MEFTEYIYQYIKNRKVCCLDNVPIDVAFDLMESFPELGMESYETALNSSRDVGRMLIHLRFENGVMRGWNNRTYIAFFSDPKTLPIGDATPRDVVDFSALQSIFDYEMQSEPAMTVDDLLDLF